jgi:hypothetical protein
LTLEGLQFKLGSGNFDFIKISTQITNNFSKFKKMQNNLIYAEVNNKIIFQKFSKKKNNLIYAKMVKVLR